MRTGDGNFKAAMPADVPEANLAPKKCAEWLCNYAVDRLTDAELNFLNSLRHWHGKPTKRQLDWLESIADGIACELQCEAAGGFAKNRPQLPPRG